MRYREILEGFNANPVSGTFVAANYTDDTVDALIDFAHDLDIPNLIDPEDFHTTIVYSTKTIHWSDKKDIGEKVTPIEWHCWPTQSHTKCLVLSVKSDYLQKRFDQAMERGATHSFDEYRPHITFSYDVGDDFSVDHLPLPDFDIVIDHEFSNPLDTNWMDKKSS